MSKVIYKNYQEEDKKFRTEIINIILEYLENKKNKSFMPKKFKEGDKFPLDFWNYNINPILGYEYKSEKRDFKKEKLKYGLNDNEIR